MKKPRTFFFLVALAVVLLSAPAAMGQVLNTDWGISERTWAYGKGNPRTDIIAFVWTPLMSVMDSAVFVVGQCVRMDDNGNLKGNHKLTFRNIVIGGVDSENMVTLPKRTSKLKRGRQKRSAMWNITSQAQASLSTDSMAVVMGEVTVSGKVNPWDILTCGLGVLEILDVTSLESSAESEKLESMQEAIERALPRSLLRAGSRKTAALCLPMPPP